jgi:hypothetical protein
VKDDALFVVQLFVDGALRRQGIGTEVVKGLIEEAARAGRAVTLDAHTDHTRIATMLTDKV